MDKTKELRDLLVQHPDRKIVFMYPNEGSDYYYSLGTTSKISVDDFVTYDEKVWVKSEIGDLIEQVADYMADDLPNESFPLSAEQEKEIEEKAKKYVSEMKWTKAIIVYIKS